MYSATIFTLLLGVAAAAPVVVTSGSVIAPESARELDEDTAIPGYGYKREAEPVVVTSGSVIAPENAHELNEDTAVPGYGY